MGRPPATGSRPAFLRAALDLGTCCLTRAADPFIIWGRSQPSRICPMSRALARASWTLAAVLSFCAALPAGAAIPSAVADTPVPSLSPMIKKVSPAVVNIATHGTVKEKGQTNPFLDDPFFRRFFDMPPD